MKRRLLSSLALLTLAAGVCARAAEVAPAAAPPASAAPAGQVQPVAPNEENPNQAPQKPAVAPPRSIYDEAFDKVIEQKKNGWLEDPLRHLEGDMSHCVGELTALKTDKPVQQRQDLIASRMDAIIKMLEKECNGGGGGGANPSRPLGRSILAKGPGGQGEMHDPKAGDKLWASLPPKQREQILQSRTEGFPPGFEALLQSYYQRLAQDQVDDPTAAPAGTGGGTDGAEPMGEAPAGPAAAAGGGAQ